MAGATEHDDRTNRFPKAVYERELFRLQAELVKVQEWVRTEGKRLVVIFEGRDAADNLSPPGPPRPATTRRARPSTSPARRAARWSGRSGAARTGSTPKTPRSALRLCTPA